MENKEQLDRIRHSCAHLLAAAVLDLYPGAHNAIGPAIENGFYQDFDLGDKKITEEDLPRIEEKMREILKTWDSFQINEVSVEQARKDFAHNPYKLELIEAFAKEGKSITETKQGGFLDLCKGGHVHHPKNDSKHFRLLSLAGAYWKGDVHNKMLTRVYGTAFKTKQELDDYLRMVEETKKRDHKKLGRELELFLFDETAPGMAYWLPNGLIVYNTLYDYAREQYKNFGYQEVATPMINKKELYETSGHWEHYRSDMFISPMSFLTNESDDPLQGSEVFGVKPMNCPNAMRIFAFKTRSYHTLPLRFAETSSLHRFELSGTLNGLFRIRQFRQDDAHIFITQDQIEEEFSHTMKMVAKMYEPFDLSYRLRLGTRPEKFMGETKDWEHAEKMLKNALDASGIEYVTAEGEGAFYGPKVDILMKDSLGREWQTGTIQLDFQQPKRFKLEYIEKDGSAKNPTVIHRAIYGSFERFLGILIEHYAGKFPLWLAPVQLALLPIADRHVEYAKKLYQDFSKEGIRVTLQDSQSTLQAKIREATLQKVPYMGIIGDKEITDEVISIRSREGEDLGKLSLSQFLQKLKEDIDKKA
ncbi:MAG: threonine--tRNA ligase [bacterium]|nr:threonine--tRNA ligase [bacterium]